MFRGGALCPRKLRQQYREPAIQNGREITAWNRMAEEILHASQLVVGLARDGALHFVPLGRERLDLWTSRSGRARIAATAGSPTRTGTLESGTRTGNSERRTGTIGVAGSLRTTAGTSGCGRTRATSCST